MNFFDYHGDTMHAERVPLSQIATEFGTPSYVYSRAAFEHQWRSLDMAFEDYPHSICYAVKANSNLAVLNLLAKLGSGFDIVSEGELRRVLLAGGDASKVVFSGVAKSRSELEFVIDAGIHCINIESEAELHRVQEVAQSKNSVVKIALRVNPDVDAQTHPYIATGLEQSKFGITMDAAFETYLLAATMPNIEIFSVACHIGSQITTLSPFNDALRRVLELVERLSAAGISLKQLDLGGGLGIDYQGEKPPTAKAYVAAILEELSSSGMQLPISIEPGRYIAGNSGVLLTEVEYLKHNSSKNFAVVDAGMNDLLRPSLYQAFHLIDNVDRSNQEIKTYDVVGPVCESADVLGYDRELAVKAGDLLAVRSAGAYGFAMVSNYNSRCRPAEVMVDGDTAHLVRRRETFEELTAGETVLPS